MKKIAVIVAGGTGRRMGAQVPKQFLLLRGKPVLWHTLRAFLNAYEDMEIVLVLPEEHRETGKTLVNALQATHRIRIVTGGATRFHSVRLGLACIGTEEQAIVFVHDGVRSLVSRELIHRCYHAAVETGNAIPAVLPVDSMRMVTDEGYRSIDRDMLRVIQTPQAFTNAILQTAFAQEYRESFTDEGSVVEATGVKINLVEGEATNIKITRPMDMIIAEEMMRAEEGREGS
jgi:2-C-methyl-D-erythritol 4-phosphate cytidylyltransferase